MSNLELFETVYYRQQDPAYRSWLSDLKHRNDALYGTQKRFRIDSISTERFYESGGAVSDYLTELNKQS